MLNSAVLHLQNGRQGLEAFMAALNLHWTIEIRDIVSLVDLQSAHNYTVFLLRCYSLLLKTFTKGVAALQGILAICLRGIAKHSRMYTTDSCPY